MKQLNAYLRFDGNCREAMSFYQECLGGELKWMTAGETPMGAQMPPEAQRRIMHSTLTIGPFVLSASDTFRQEVLTNANSITMMIDCSSEDEITAFFSKLSAGGTIIAPLKKEFWGGIFAQFTDKFGKEWMLNCDKA